MGTRLSWIMAAGLPLLLIGGTPAIGLSAQGEQASTPAKEAPATPEATKAPTGQEASKAPEASPKPAAAKQPAGMVGKVIAITPQSDTIVVDVPEGKETLRIGAEVTDRTKIMVNGKKASLQDLKNGERVRISYHRTPAGDIANSLVALPTKG